MSIAKIRTTSWYSRSKWFKSPFFSHKIRGIRTRRGLGSKNQYYIYLFLWLHFVPLTGAFHHVCLRSICHGWEFGSLWNYLCIFFWSFNGLLCETEFRRYYSGIHVLRFLFIDLTALFSLLLFFLFSFLSFDVPRYLITYYWLQIVGSCSVTNSLSIVRCRILGFRLCRTCVIQLRSSVSFWIYCYGLCAFNRYFSLELDSAQFDFFLAFIRLFFLIVHLWIMLLDLLHSRESCSNLSHFSGDQYFSKRGWGYFIYQSNCNVVYWRYIDFLFLVVFWRGRLGFFFLLLTPYIPFFPPFQHFIVVFAFSHFRFFVLVLLLHICLILLKSPIFSVGMRGSMSFALTVNMVANDISDSKFARYCLSSCLIICVGTVRIVLSIVIHIFFWIAFFTIFSSTM